VAQLAERQWGVVSHDQLIQAGFSRMTIGRWIDESRLHRIHRRVYAVGHPALGTEGKLAAALFYAGRGAALWGVTAGSWLGMLKVKPRRIHICVSRRRQSLPDVRVHCEKKFERVWHRRLPVTPPAQTLLDIAAVVELPQLRRALAEAEYQKLVTLGEVDAVLGRGRRGSAALRKALDRHRPELAQTRSRMEDEFVLFCERFTHQQPAMNVKVGRWTVDAIWKEARVVVELDSRAAHGTPAAVEQDRRRDLDLRAAGYTVLRYTWRQLTQQPDLIHADLARHGVGSSHAL
jgi:very-short-patch-repair endonuclease